MGEFGYGLGFGAIDVLNLHQVKRIYFLPMCRACDASSFSNGGVGCASVSGLHWQQP
jgi:hypothetical protein